jgi:hypothetical protein
VVLDVEVTDLDGIRVAGGGSCHERRRPGADPGEAGETFCRVVTGVGTQRYAADPVRCGDSR